MSVRLKLFFGFGLLTAIVLAMGALGYKTITDQADRFKTLLYEDSAFSTLSKDIKNIMLMHRRYEKDFFINTGKPEKQASYKKKFNIQSEIIRDKIKILEELSARIKGIDAETGALVDSLMENHEAYRKGALSIMNTMEQDSTMTTQTANSSMKPFKEKIHELESAVDLLAEYGGNKLVEESEAALASAKQGQTLIAFAAVVGSIFSILMALAGTLMVTRPIKAIVASAQRVAGGDFSEDLEGRYQAEMGQVAHAITSIKKSLSEVLDEFAFMSARIASGEITVRGNPDNFKGAYSELMRNGNTLARSYTRVLDELPSPLMVINKGFEIQYINNAGAGLGGVEPKDLHGTHCYDHFRTSDCKTDKCACARAMAKLGKASSETDAHPGKLDLEIEYLAVPVRDGLGKCTGAIEIVADQTKVKQAQRMIQKTANETAEIVGRLSAAAEELSAQVEQSSRGADEQKSMTGEAATAMEEMNATVLEVARNAAQASESTEEARNRARSGGEIVKELVRSIGRVQEMAVAMTKNVSDLGAKAEDIGQVINVISDIADQTNLLALNAAIEAARAGEAGRGFAVVADEVRKLAEKTMSATKEVEGAIRAIQEVTQVNVRDMNEAGKAVEASTLQARNAGDSLADIVEMVESSADQVRNIATASEEQSAASSEIERTVEDINTISTETAEAMTQSSQAIMELARLAQELDTLIRELKSD